MSQAASPPLIVHIVHRFSVGGLENGLVNLLNRLPASLARHCVISLTTVDPQFVKRVQAPNIEFVELRKRDGQTAWILPALYRELRRRRPAIVHTRNITTLECQIAALLARVPVRIHGEHGWDVNDLHGANQRYARLRRLLKHLVHHQIALSSRTHAYLRDVIGVAPARLSNLCNGVDAVRFTAEGAASIPVEDTFIVGTVGRLAPVKNQHLLCEAFLMLRQRNPAFRERGRLLIVGDGPDHAALQDLVAGAGAASAVRFAGEQDDIAQWLRAMDVFCLPSLAEGISNSILEAMACGRPVIATDVGGNAELVDDGTTGCLLPQSEAGALAKAINTYFDDPDLAARHGREGRARAVRQFSLEIMVDSYAALYARLTAPLSADWPAGQAQAEQRIEKPREEKHPCAG